MLQAGLGMNTGQLMTIRSRRSVFKVLDVLGANEVRGVRTVAVGDDE